MITFYERARGAGHVERDKPCQDDGCHESKEDSGIYVIVACDGHGDDCCVRSDRGAHLAANIAKEKILSFVGATSPELFAKSAGAMPPQAEGVRVVSAPLSEAQQELVAQEEAYRQACEKYPTIECAMRCLFSDIVTSWREAIANDLEAHPYTPAEHEHHPRHLTHAYGTTLIAAVCTPHYWFAFHIGDGKLLICDERLQWREPIPDDCRCFLNRTTSLCDEHATEHFRYAFDATGAFPVAFLCGSDGVDGTYFQSSLLHEFYSRLLHIFHSHPTEEALSFLRDYLPTVSAIGSKDDVSIAAIIDETRLEQPMQYYEYYSLDKQLQALSATKVRQEQDIAHLRKDYDRSLATAQKLQRDYNAFCRAAWQRVRQWLRQRQQDKESIACRRERWQCAVAVTTETKEHISTKEEEYKQWCNDNVEQYNALRQRMKELSIHLSLPATHTDESHRPAASQAHSAPSAEGTTTKATPISPKEQQQREAQANQQAQQLLSSTTSSSHPTGRCSQPDVPHKNKNTSTSIKKDNRK